MTEKAKQTPQTLTSRLISWLIPPLLIVGLFIGLIIIDDGMVAYRKSLLTPGGPTLPYLSMLVDDREHGNLLTLIGLSLCVVYVLLLRKRSLGVKLFWGGVAVLFILFPLTARFYPVNTVIQSLSANDHAYHLVQQETCDKRYYCDSSWPGFLLYRYTVIECSALGWSCQVYGSPFYRRLEPATCFVDPATLVQNPITHAVELTATTETRAYDGEDYKARHSRPMCLKGVWR